MKKSSIARAAVAIMAITLVGRILGFVRDTLVARQYGATSTTDAYLVAYTLPYFLQYVLGVALVNSIVPVVTKYLVKNDEKEAWRIASITLNWTALFMSAFTILGILGSRILVNALAPGFDSNTADLATILTIIMFPSIIFVGIGMLITGILNAQKSFAVAAFAPGFANIIIIIFILTLGKYGVHYLAWGTFLSMVGLMIIQMPVLKKAGFHYSWDWDLRHPEVKGIFYNLLPIIIGTAVNQLYLAINQYYASGLTAGSISALNYAGKIFNLPTGVFVSAIASAIFPTLSEHSVRSDWRAFGVTLVRGMKLVLLVILPAAAGLMALKVPIVQLLFERGAFTPSATLMTADALFYFSIGMFAMAVNMVITRAYYAFRDVKTPLFVGLASILVDILASLVLVGPMGHNGLALSNTIAAVFSAITMYLLLKKHLQELYLSELLTSAFKALTASVLTALAAWETWRFLAGHVFHTASTKAHLLETMVAIAVGMAVYGIGIVLLRESEVLGIIKKMQERIKGGLLC